jgi:hypothetical protein
VTLRGRFRHDRIACGEIPGIATESVELHKAGTRVREFEQKLEKTPQETEQKPNQANAEAAECRRCLPETAADRDQFAAKLDNLTRAPGPEKLGQSGINEKLVEAAGTRLDALHDVDGNFSGEAALKARRLPQGQEYSSVFQHLNICPT